MSRRIRTAIVVITAVAVGAFAVPLAIAVQRLYRDQAVFQLEREAARAAIQVPAAFQSSSDPVELPAATGATQLALYDPSGARLLGAGPPQGDAVVQQAMDGHVTDGYNDDFLVVATPLTADEHVFGVLRAALPRAAVNRRVWHAWLGMLFLGLLIIGAATLVSTLVARRLTRPVGDLADAAAKLGSGDFAARAGRSGIPELDAAAANLDATAQRLGQVLQRERSFSADASHQLRTPLTGLRLHLEAAIANPDSARDESLTVALAEVDRLEQTIDGLLALARDTEPARTVLQLGPVLDDIEASWHGHLAALGRPLRVFADDDLAPVRAAPEAVRQILDVLVANAAEHGAGAVQVHARRTPNGVAIDVTDEGQGVRGDVEQLFERRSRSSPGKGIGLPLARSLAEAEGGRLVVRDAGSRPTFSLLLAHAREDG